MHPIDPVALDALRCRRRNTPRSEITAWVDALFDASPDPPETTAVALYEAFVAEFPQGEVWGSSPIAPACDVVAARRIVQGAAATVGLIERVPDDLRGWRGDEALRLPIAAVTACLASDPDQADVRAATYGLLDRLAEATGIFEGERLVLQLRAPLTLASTIGIDEAARLAFSDADTWGAALRRWVTTAHEDDAGVTRLLALAARPLSSKKPNRRWQKECAAVLAECPAAEDVAMTALAALIAAPDRPFATHFGSYTNFLDPTNRETAKTLLWTAVQLRPEGLPALLADVAIHCAPGPLDQKLSNAAVLALGELATRDAVAALARALLRIRNKNTLKELAKALDSAAAKAGVPPDELLEMCVPDLGLDECRRRQAAFGDVVATLAVESATTANLAWSSGDGTPLRSPPKAVLVDHGSEVAGLKTDLRELRATLATERARVEDLLAAPWTRPWPVWDERSRAHPVTGAVTANLVWRVPCAGVERTGIAGTRERTFVDAEGLVFEADAQGAIGLWHPVGAPAGEVAAWRARMLADERVQPFKQAYRECYSPTPAERETATYSNRFAGHILQYRRFQALVKARRWHAPQLGTWDQGYCVDAVREFSGHGLRAELEHELVESEDTRSEGIPQHCTTDRVRFVRTADGAAVALDDVPPAVFSEAMRDVDLFVSVTSIAIDPEWADRGPDAPLGAYWSASAFGVLSEIARTRREALERVVASLRIRDRCSFEERALVVRGQLGTYRIHIGTGNVMMEPGSRYVCIVVDRKAMRRMPAFFLPFDDDALLPVILSKALLLAEDDKIKDPSIRSQLQP